MTASFCPGCGFGVPTDQGCCATCGATAQGPAADALAKVLTPDQVATLAKLLQADQPSEVVAEDLLDPDVADFVAEVDGLLERLDDLPSRAADFEGGVREKLQSIRAWCVEYNGFTGRQRQAVENMGRGVERWGA